MALSSWLSRLRSSSKPIYSNFKNSLVHKQNTRLARTLIVGSENREKPFQSSWSNPLLVMAAAASAGSIALQLQNNDGSSFCDAPNINQIGKRIGGNGVKGSHTKVPQELIYELKVICQDNMTVDYDDRYSYGKPQNSFHKAVNIPDAVVIPRSQEEVSKIVKSCNKHKVPIIPFGGATSLEGHTLSPNRGVCIDMSRMKNIKSLNFDDMDVVVEPGIGWMELDEYLEPYGLFFPLDPGPGATIGGMCATRFSGSLAVRYGTMRNNVINLKVVLANGDIIETGSHARKSSAGLQCVTFLQLKMQQMLLLPLCCLAYVSRVELMDEVQVRAINLANSKNLPEVPTLLFEFIGTEAYAREQTLIVQKIASEHNGSDFVFAEDPEGKKELWKLRKEALWACFAMVPNSEAMITDVRVPLSRLAELISRAKQELGSSSLVCTVVAHTGDGNFHAVILFDPDQEEQRKEAERLNQFIVHTALAMEGTCTGEHGVGTGKMKYLKEELGIENLRTMERIKDALDPNSIMNPGKLIPPHVCL